MHVGSQSLGMKQGSKSDCWVTRTGSHSPAEAGSGWGDGTGGNQLKAQVWGKTVTSSGCVEFKELQPLRLTLFKRQKLGMCAPVNPRHLGDQCRKMERSRPVWAPLRDCLKGLGNVAQGWSSPWSVTSTRRKENKNAGLEGKAVVSRQH